MRPDSVPPVGTVEQPEEVRSIEENRARVQRQRAIRRLRYGGGRGRRLPPRPKGVPAPLPRSKNKPE